MVGPHVGEHRFGTARDQSAGDAEPDPARAAGDERGLALDGVDAHAPLLSRAILQDAGEADLAMGAMGGRNRVTQSGAAGGAEGNRTPDLCSAIAALSHLSYSPAPGPASPGGAPLAAQPPTCNRLARTARGERKRRGKRAGIACDSRPVHRFTRSVPIRGRPGGKARDQRLGRNRVDLDHATGKRGPAAARAAARRRRSLSAAASIGRIIVRTPSKVGEDLLDRHPEEIGDAEGERQRGIVAPVSIALTLWRET